MKHGSWLLAMAMALASAVPLAHGADLTQQQRALREIYQELVETNTTNSTGSCTVAANRMAARLKAAGYTDADLQLIVPPGGPAKGNLVARLKGDGSRKPLLLLAHIDVVEANRVDWTRDPFKLVEEDGMFYARGASDDKAMASVFVANMIRYRNERLPLKRDIIMALTCDEEIVPSAFDGAQYLVEHHRALIDAEIALNEGAGGMVDKDGKPVWLGIQAGEKVYQSFQLETTSPGGHSSLPARDNAITRLADGLSRLGNFTFPFRLSDVTRRYYAQSALVEKGPVAADMKAILADPPDQAALDRLYALHPMYNANVRTTCVATRVEAGHADNALPQRARATVNCRILPQDSIDEVQRTLVRVVADDTIKVTRVGEGLASPMPTLTPTLMHAVTDTANAVWPGVTVIPALLAGATDGRFLNNAGIPTYGISGMFAGPEPSGVHGLNEHLRVKSLYDGQEFLYRLGKRLATE